MAVFREPTNIFPRHLRSMAIGLLVVFSSAVNGGTLPTNQPIFSPGAAAVQNETRIAIPGHILPTLTGARPVGQFRGTEELVLTLVLRRDDTPGFESFLNDVYEPSSGNYRQFLTPEQLAQRFGPSLDTYQDLTSYLESFGFTIVQSAPGRQTLTVRGTREAALQAFSVRVLDYVLQERVFSAIESDPMLPARLASHIEAISGLMVFAVPSPVTVDQGFELCGVIVEVFGSIPVISLLSNIVGKLCTVGQAIHNTDTPSDFCDYLPPQSRVPCRAYVDGVAPEYPDPFPGTATGDDTANPPSPGGGPTLVANQVLAFEPLTPVQGTGQVIGITSFSSFNTNDVKDWLALMGMNPARINQLTRVPVNGGATTSANETEVLLDIAAVWSIASGAEIRVYEAPFSGPGSSFQALFSAMIAGGVDIITNSFAYCENNTSPADLSSIDSILQTAAAAGISVFSASGDRGSTCLNGSPNTAHVPSSSPNLTAVGGSSLSYGPGFTYGSETWWNGSNAVPPTGQGGFGLSSHFNRPAYQNGLNANPKRSLPDVVINADPAHGYILCQANDGGCPTGKVYGGTSVAAPIWASFTALLNEVQGSNLGFLNPLIYPHAGTAAFHNAASMGSDFAHVGLGSPNLDVLFRLLNAITSGAPNASASTVYYAGTILDGHYDFPVQGIPANGVSAAVVVVTLRDIDGYTLSGRNISLNTDSINVVVQPAGPVATDSNGQSAFQLRNLSPEVVTVTATDTLSATVLDLHPIIPFGVPPAASAGISAFPTTVNANGTATTTITITLLDGLARPTPDKKVRLEQGNGHSVITGPNPPLTDSNGEIEFTATNVVNETVTYTANVVSDINLPVPGNVQVTFQAGGGGCGSAAQPVGLNGYSVESFANGFAAGPLNYGSINFGTCLGASLPAFLDETVYIANSRTGGVFTFGPPGGAAVTPLSTIGPTLAVETVGKDEKLYGRRVATTGNFNTGAIVELDPDTGAVLRTVASSLKCPYSLVTDPISGDLFYDAFCNGNGSNDATIHRVRNPASVTPTVEVYATLPKSPNGQMSFAPDGTLFVVSGYLDAQPAVIKVSSTDSPQPPTVDTVPDVYSYFWISVVEAGPDGEATTLAGSQAGGLTLFDLTQSPPDTTIIAQEIGSGVVGPDGCLYATQQYTVFKILGPGGVCGFKPSGVNPSLRLEISPDSPAPNQGLNQRVLATTRNFSSGVDVIIDFQISGANDQIRQVRTGVDGTALLEYEAWFAGTDQITATALLPDSNIPSNAIELELATGRHTSFLSLNQSAVSGTPGSPAMLRANLVDISRSPAVAISGQTINFTVGPWNCLAVTDSFGTASCQVTPLSTGDFNLSASYGGNGNYTPDADSTGFTVFAPGALDTLFKDGFEAIFSP